MSRVCPLGFPACKRELCEWYWREWSMKHKESVGTCSLDRAAAQIVPDQKEETNA